MPAVLHVRHGLQDNALAILFNRGLGYVSCRVRLEQSCTVPGDTSYLTMFKRDNISPIP